MIDKIIDYALKHRLLTILLVILALILAYDGYKAFKRYKSGEAAAPAEAEKASA